MTEKKKTADLTAEVAEVKAVLKTEAEKIWNEIRNLNVDLFALPNQKVNDHCEPVQVEPNKLFLLATASAFLPALESSLGTKFLVEKLDKFIVVSRAKATPSY